MYVYFDHSGAFQRCITELWALQLRNASFDSCATADAIIALVSQLYQQSLGCSLDLEALRLRQCRFRVICTSSGDTSLLATRFAHG
jgi:hypothetical protein